MALDTLQARGRALALFERYGALLTDHQREVVDLYLRSDWSLAEIASHQGTSRAAVHDIVRRSTQSLQEYERRLGLLAEAARRRRAMERLERELNSLKRRIASLDATV
ncbi:MAG TPA: sigma factor-like helix-turn-helix DNA-binding protein [Candidatus Dormibacteraeota bacterium]|nr:sigma factor-like helix-turn-helix DNA-binding protein [Candidatus Dormibacteraeota bacterium]